MDQKKTLVLVGVVAAVVAAVGIVALVVTLWVFRASDNARRAAEEKELEQVAKEFQRDMDRMGFKPPAKKTKPSTTKKKTTKAVRAD
jgi:type II secretory pathway pseudopilin PulG